MLHDQAPGQDLLNGRGDRESFRSRSKPRAPVRGEAPRENSRGGDRRNQGEGPADTAAYGTGAERPVLAEEESRRLFISIGRNRRLFPREILGLIITKAQVNREDIGAIRILDSYSFVQVRDTAADAIISALNGAMFRGRTLVVNYARSRREEGSPEGGIPSSGELRDEAPDGAAFPETGAPDGAGEDSEAGTAGVDAEGGAVPGETAFPETGAPDGAPPAGAPPPEGDAEGRAPAEAPPDREFPLEHDDDHHEEEGVEADTP
jgi:hypothetical protein